MQTILGSGGAIGNALANALPAYADDIRLVSRNPQKINTGDKLVKADLTNRKQTLEAVKDSEVVYLTVGLPYDLKIWRSSWPVIMENVLLACEQHKAKLVFFDNVYMYDPNHLNPMTEQTPINPCSQKGEIRADLVRMIWQKVEEGNLQALIARSADFYGPSIKGSSVLTETVLNNLANGKKANWLGSVNYKHSYTYTPDAGKATALLGNDPEAYNQVWHLPTASNPPTGKEWIEMIAKALHVEAKYRAVPKFMVRMMGLFSGVMGEMVEMMYQYDRDYVFNSSKFEDKFEMYPTSYNDGIQEVVDKDYKNI